MKLPLTIACWDYDRTARLMNGEVPIEGCDPNFLNLPVEETFFRALRGTEFDVAELSMSSYTMLLSKGASPYVALPVFLSRAFRHSAIYVREGSDIKTPQDLVGRQVGVPEYQLTAPVWVRGILEDEYGVRPRDIRWRTGGVEAPGRHEKVDLSLPAEIDLQPIAEGRTLNEMLLSGEIDALVAPRAPSSFHLPGRPVKRLFEDFRSVESAYFAKTGIFPIMHVVGVRRSLVEANPWLPMSLLKAFTRAKDLALAELGEVAALKISLPWAPAEHEQTVAAMGEDFWSYGVGPNEKVLDTFLRYHHEQGLSKRRVTVDEMFAAGTREKFVI
ncbi:ABC transporter substrate-binding protein [Ramlibacter sp. MAHUQ-53]|uniref:ABC transporter substrate-binding protein n=1 Tax=unclassified Ramlibacter TaxID=2617605 RepID=UPI003626AF86